MAEESLDRKREALNALRHQVSMLEAEITEQEIPRDWKPEKFYSAYYITTGFVLGGVAAMASLLFNVIGSTITQRNSLEIIRVYLTFPLGEQALKLGTAEGAKYVISDGMIIALGCCLYIGTGMVLGTLFHVVISMFGENKSLTTRLVIGSVLGIVIWGVNYYLILSWLQPLLFGGRWITDGSLLPWWVAAATHLVFGWTMALMAPIGAYTPYKRPTD
jgi:F0F1-type ATP synthase membrane subunit c/vacuolar-type H+-ATPase subunit K